MAVLADRPVASPDASLYGRDAEIARIDALLEGARLSRSGALVVRGVAGAGKSALLEHARAEASDMYVLACAGVESETELPFAALHQLVRPILPLAAALPEIQSRALRTAIGLERAGGEQRFLVSIALLSLLAEAAEERPLLCLVDDAHWLDGASADTLLFVARRLEAERIALLFAARDGEARRFDAPAVPELHLGGLDATAAARLLDHHADSLSADVRERLLIATEGNPLALVELSSALTARQRSGSEPVFGPLPVSWRVEQAFLARVRELPEPTQTLLLVAAADDTGELATVLDAARQLGVAPVALDPAERAELVRVRRGRVEWRHPLVRSAVYQGAPSSQQRAAHAALAEVLVAAAHADRRAWHRAASTLEPDPAVVDALEQVAQRARSRAAFGAASLAFERAAALSADDEQRALELAAAGENAWVAGRSDRALALLDRARPLTAQPLLRAEIDRTRGLIGLYSAVPADACQLLLTAAADVERVDGGLALHLLSLASRAAIYARDGQAIATIAAAADRIDADDSATSRLLSHHLRGVGAHYAGDFARAAVPLRAALELAREIDEQSSAELDEILIIVASVGLFLGDDRAAHDLHRRMVSRARNSGALAILAWALPRLAVTDVWAGRWPAASAGLAEAAELARAIGQHVILSFVLCEQAMVAALRGDEEECRARIAESLELASGRGLTWIEDLATSALMTLELGLGNADDALARSRVCATRPGSDLWGPLERIEAAVRAGDPELARESLEPFESWAESVGAAWARAVALHCRALLSAEPSEAERLFLAALAMHERSSRPFERARTEFAFGEFLRRSRRRVEAREHLRAALELFERLGAKLWAERARVELRASGQTARRRDPTTLDDLTPQELQIAGRVAQGLTNREIAAQLFLSPRTIDFHLRNVFRKLGITSRTELARMDLDAA